MSDGLDLEDWLDHTSDRRAELLAYSKTPLASDAGERHKDMDAAVQNAADAGQMLADAEGYLIQATAQAVLVIRHDHENLDANERKALVKDRVWKIQRLVDGLSVVVKSINGRIFLAMNQNRSRL